MLPRNPLYEISHIHIVPARLKLLNALTRNAPALRRLALSINEYRSPQSAVYRSSMTSQCGLLYLSDKGLAAAANLFKIDKPIPFRSSVT